MNRDLSKMLKCFTNRSNYRSLQEEVYSQINVGIKSSEDDESSTSSGTPEPCRQSCHSDDNCSSHSSKGVITNLNPSTTTTSSSGGSSGGGGGRGGGTFYQIKLALGLQKSRLGTRHLEKQRSAGDRSDESEGASGRYTLFPTGVSSATSRRRSAGDVTAVRLNRDTENAVQQILASASSADKKSGQPTNSFDATHIHLTPNTKTFAHPHKGAVYPPNSVTQTTRSAGSGSVSGGVSSLSSFAARCLRLPSWKESKRHQLREKSKSDNSLNRISRQSVRTNANSWTDTISSARVQQQLTRHSTPDDWRSRSTVVKPILLPVRVHSSKSRNALPRRSRSLERCSNFRIYPTSSSSSSSQTPISPEQPPRPSTSSRITAGTSHSLERNHKFRIRPNLGGESGARYVGPEPSNRQEGNSNSTNFHPLTNRGLDMASAASRCTGTGRAGASVAPSIGGASGSSTSNSSSNPSGRPARAWIHPDHQIDREGITYAVRYIGCLEVHTSMKSLDFETRSLIAKECINRVCEAAGLKTVDRKRKVDRKIHRILGDTPNMEHAGENIRLTVKSDCLRLTTLETGQLIASHAMPNISFASGGDPDTLDFVAYVAKDSVHCRACFVLECGGGLAQEVITTIGQAFELRYKEFIKRAPKVIFVADKMESSVFTGESSAWGDDPEYYNDLPGKVPPEMVTNQAQPSTTAPTDVPKTRKESGNLIDLSSEPPSPRPGHEYVNGSVMDSFLEGKPVVDSEPSPHADPFDMQPFAAALPTPAPPKLTPAVQKAQLMKEDWFHGPVSRKEAEALLIHEGDFLVRESQGSPGQYVLTGMQSNSRKHLLLVDPEGVVRTKDRTFESVSHLINYHRNNGLPIISAESALVLRNAVPRVKQL